MDWLELLAAQGILSRACLNLEASVLVLHSTQSLESQRLTSGPYFIEGLPVLLPLEPHIGIFLFLLLLLLSRFSRVRLFATLCTVAHQVLRPWDSPGKSTGVGCHFLLQGIFPTQGSNPGLLHCRQTL